MSNAETVRAVSFHHVPVREGEGVFLYPGERVLSVEYNAEGGWFYAIILSPWRLAEALGRPVPRVFEPGSSWHCTDACDHAAGQYQCEQSDGCDHDWKLGATEGDMVQEYCTKCDDWRRVPAHSDGPGAGGSMES